MPFSIGSQSILSREDLERSGGAFRVSLTIENPELIKQWFDMKDEFTKRAEAVFLRYVFQVHKYLIRLTPVDGGELRGGWTSILDKYSQSYDRQFFDTALYDPWKAANKTPYFQEYHWDPSLIAKGKTESEFQDNPFNVILINNVPHGEYLEFGTSLIQGRHFLELSRYKAELWFPVIFESWFKKISQEGKVVDLDTPDEELEITS